MMQEIMDQEERVMLDQIAKLTEEIMLNGLVTNTIRLGFSTKTMTLNNPPVSAKCFSFPLS